MDDTLKPLLAYQNKYVLHRFNKLFPVAKADAEQVFEDTIRFMWLVDLMNKKRATDAETPDVYLPDCMAVIDEMWHAFILDTVAYNKFCETHFGNYIHHPPAVPKYARNYKNMDKEAAYEIMLTEMISCVYEHLGEDVALRWFDTYKKYEIDLVM